MFLVSGCDLISFGQRRLRNKAYAVMSRAAWVEGITASFPLCGLQRRPHNEGDGTNSNERRLGTRKTTEIPPNETYGRARMMVEWNYERAMKTYDL